MKIINNKNQVKDSLSNNCMLWHGDVENFLDALPKGLYFDLIITSPPYNIGKPYEKPQELKEYMKWQEKVIKKCLKFLKPTGSICWQVGNFIQKGKTGKESSVLPLDILFFDIFRKHNLKLRNRIIWHFGHGLQCKHRFSGRYEVVLWFTKTDDYIFELDPIRVKSKYPGKKHFKGPKKGQYSGNPKGKNPEDLWSINSEMLTTWDNPVWEIPNVKSNHVEKTEHPCQFPIALVDRFILSMTPVGGLVFDPFAGVASTGIASVINERRFWGCEIDDTYIKIGEDRLLQALNGEAKYRPFEKPVYDHTQSNLSKEPLRNEN